MALKTVRQWLGNADNSDKVWIVIWLSEARQPGAGADTCSQFECTVEPLYPGSVGPSKHATFPFRHAPNKRSMSL